MKNYSWLPDKFVDEGDGLIFNGKRFDGSASTAPSEYRDLKIRITYDSLMRLDQSPEFIGWMSQHSSPFSAEDVYGANGKLGWLWPKTWDSPLEMLSDFCTNMGGGVPIELIREFVDICFQEAISK